MVSEQKWCLALQADIHHRPRLFPGQCWTSQESLPPNHLRWLTPRNLKSCAFSAGLPFCYDVYLACRWANWKRHHALSCHHLVIVRKSWERHGNDCTTPTLCPFPRKKKQTKLPLIQVYGLHILTFRSLCTMPFRWQWFTLSRICCIQWL